MIAAALVLGAAVAQEPASTEEAESPAPAHAPVAPAPLPSLPPPWSSGGEARLEAPLVALQRVRFERSRRAAVGLGMVALGEVGVAFLATVGDADAGNGAAAALGVAGAIHGVSAWYQLDLNHRRSSSFSARLADAAAGPPEAWEALLRRQRLEAERTARAQAFTTGLYGGVLGFALSGAVITAALQRGELDLAPVQGASFGLLAFGVTGLVTHGSRWRASSRLANDLAALDWRPSQASPALAE